LSFGDLRHRHAGQPVLGDQRRVALIGGLPTASRCASIVGSRSSHGKSIIRDDAILDDELTATECIEKLGTTERHRREDDKEPLMSDLPSHRDTAGSTDPASRISDRRMAAGPKVLLAVAVVGVLVLLAVLHLTGVLGGESH